MNWKDLAFLQTQEKYPSISIFVRTHRAMPLREKDPIVIKNLVAEAKERLLKEFPEREVKGVIENLDGIVATIDYTKLDEGLAIFVSSDIKQIFMFSVPLENRVFIDKRFMTREIMSVLMRMPRYWVLSLSEKPTRLFSAVADSLFEVVEPEKDTMGVSRDGFPYEYFKPDIETYGYAVGKEVGRNSHLDSKYIDDRLKTFLAKVDHLLIPFLKDDPRPLFVAGVEKNLALFKEVTKHKLAEFIPGDFTEAGSKTLAKAAWIAMQRYLDSERAKKVAEFKEAMNRKQHAFGFESVWRMARAGRINNLLVEEGFVVAGKVNPENPDNVIITDNQQTNGVSEDLVNQIIGMVIEKGGGKVTICKKDQLKDYDHIAAILRY